MTTQESIERFASNFVLDEYQSRCVVDAIKKPEKLMRKICHSISDVFPKQYALGKISFIDQDDCIFFDLTGRMEELTWGQASKSMTTHGGGGYLVIEKNGNKFYAESEGHPPSEIYTGVANNPKETNQKPEAAF